MNMNKKFKKTLLAAALTFASVQATAAGFQLNAQSATGLGRAFAGDAVIADNASVMARNAAAMALFDTTALSLGANVIKSEISVSETNYSPLFGDDVESNYHEAGDTSIAPNIHLIVPVNEKFALGVNMYTNFGTKTEFGNDFAASEFGGLTDIKSVNMGLAASYRINQQWSVGAGLDIIYGTGKVERSISTPLGNAELLDVDVAGFGVGFNLGTVFELNDNNRFGLAYHYSPEVEATGDVIIGGQDASDGVYLPLPDMVEFSGYHRLTDSKFAVHYSVQWIGWSAFETLDTKNGTVLEEYHWKDAMHFSLGGTYYLNNSWTLRTGYMYDQSAQDEVTSISVPDSDRQWFSAGFTYHINEKSNVDFGATYLLGKDVSVSETSSLGTTITGTTHADALLMAMQYSRSF